MEAVLLTIALLYMIWSVAVLVFDADIWLKNKLKADKPKYEAKESPPPRGDDFIVKHTYTVSPKTDSMEQVKPKEDGETVKESEVTFEDDKLPKKSARIPDDKLDEAFTDTRIEDVGVEFDDSEEEPTVEQASGNSFEEIDKAVETATKPNVTNEECVHAGKVFSEMEGNELFNMIAERSKIIKRRIDALMELHMSNISSDKPMSGKSTKVIKKKKLVVPEDFKDFNISAVFCQCYYSFLCLSCLSESHSTSFVLTIKVHCVDAFYFCTVEHFFNSFFDLRFCSLCVYKECIFLVSHQIHAFLCDNRFKDYIIILNVCHYAYTSSIAATASLVTTTVSYLRISYTLMLFNAVVATLGKLLADLTTTSSFSFVTIKAFSTLRLSKTALICFVLISANFNSSNTMNLLSLTLDVKTDFIASCFSFLFIFTE